MSRRLQYLLASFSVLALACAALWIGAVSPLHAAPQRPEVKRLEVDRAVQSERAITKIRPMYPPPARRSRVQGTVNPSIVIDEDGSVQSIDFASGHPLLIPAAVDAVQQWRYSPTWLNGQPVEVETTVEINFTLAE